MPEQEIIKSKYPLAYDAVSSIIWAMESSYLEIMLNVLFNQNESIEVLEARFGRRLDNTHTVTTREGVAIIPIEGPIFRRANLFTLISGGTSTDILATDLQAALDDRQVHSILLNIDSPGGEAAGINELANMIFAARKKKPVMAYIDGMGASGAYWIASAAENVAIDDSAILGSIGVVMVVPDSRKYDERVGVTRHQFVSSDSPNKRPDPNTEAGKAEFQRIVDNMGEVFISAVARNRDVSEETVKEDFGRGGVLVGRAAVTAGLADRVSSFEDVLNEMVEKQSSGAVPVITGSQEPTQEGEAMPGQESKPEVKPEVKPGAVSTGKPESKVEAKPETTQTVNPEPKTEKPAGTQAIEPKAQPTVKQESAPASDPDLARRLAATEAELAASKQTAEAQAAALKQATERIEAMERQNRTMRYVEMVEGRQADGSHGAQWFGDKDKHVAFLESLCQSFGEESEPFAQYVTNQRQVAEAMAASGLFEEIGTTRAPAGASAADKLDAEAKRIQAENKELTYQQAYAQATDANPNLYQEYLNENRVS